MFLGINSSAVNANVVEGHSLTAAQSASHAAAQPAISSILAPGAEPTSAFLALNLLEQAASWAQTSPGINAMYTALDDGVHRLHNTFLITEAANSEIF